MPPRRVQQFASELRFDAHLRARWETERDIVRYAVVLVAAVGETWRPVVLFDCSHDDRNDRHDYSFSGVKHQAVIFHHGTPAEGMRTGIDLIRSNYARMIERWRQ